jgi:hypothetical protein
VRGALEFLLKELGTNVDAAGKYASKHFSVVLVMVFLGTFFGMLLFGERAGLVAAMVAYSFHLYESGVDDVLASALMAVVFAYVLRYFDRTVHIMDFVIAAVVMTALVFVYKALGRYASREEPEDIYAEIE